MEPLYQIKIQCICCETFFMTSRVRPSFKKAMKTDTDFCGYFKNDINPDYYVVRVCPTCGFASTENGINRLSDGQKSAYLDSIGSRWVSRDYGGARDVEEAIVCYKLALIIGQTIGEKERVVAGVLHHLAWLYRYVSNKDEEQRFLRFALQSYIKVYEEEGEEVNNARLMYIIGELNRRIGERHEAVRWFSRIVNDKRIMDAAMIRTSREQWQLVREEMTIEQQGLSDGSSERNSAGASASSSV